MLSRVLQVENHWSSQQTRVTKASNHLPKTMQSECSLVCGWSHGLADCELCIVIWALRTNDVSAIV